MDGPKFIFLHTKAIHFQTMMTTVNEVNNNLTKVPDEFIFRSVSVVYFTTRLNQ